MEEGKLGCEDVRNESGLVRKTRKERETMTERPGRRERDHDIQRKLCHMLSWVLLIRTYLITQD